MAKSKKKDCDNSCLMCRLCLKEWIPAIKANRSLLDYKKGEMLFTENDLIEGMFFIYEGSVKVHKHWGTDKELIVRIAGKGDIVGHRGLGGDEYYPVTGTALEPVTACYVNMDFFKATLKVNHELLYQLMLFFADELKYSERRMHSLAHMPVKGRLAQALLMLHNKFGVHETNGAIGLTLARQDLAALTGTTYETVFRMLSEMAAEQMVSVEGKQITITDTEKLKAVILQQNTAT